MQDHFLSWLIDNPNLEAQGVSLSSERILAGLISHTQSVFAHTFEISTHPMEKDLFKNILNVVVVDP